MIFHEFTLGDVEDPEIYAAGPLYAWQNTEKGQWVLEHFKDTAYRIGVDQNSFGYKVTVYGNLSQQDATYFTLKYQ